MPTKFMYLRPTRAMQPVGCVAFTTSENLIHYQLSVVNPSDNFDRSRGRSIAEARLVKSPINIQTALPASEMNYWEVLSTIMSHLSESKSAPARAAKTAKNWLGVNTAAPVVACGVDLSCN